MAPAKSTPAVNPSGESATKSSAVSISARPHVSPSASWSTPASSFRRSRFPMDSSRPMPGETTIGHVGRRSSERRCPHHPVPGREARRCRHQQRPGATSIGDVTGEVMACDAARSQAEPNTSRDDEADDWADDASCPREPDDGCDADEALRHRCDDTTVCKTWDGRDVPWACSTRVTRAVPAGHQVTKPRRRRRRYELKDISGSWPPKSSRRPGRC
jgi:hypothetical protein